MKNMEPGKNNVSKSCNSGRADDKIQHGIGISVCVIRQNGSHLVKGSLHLSYSNNTYGIVNINDSLKISGDGSVYSRRNNAF